MHMCVKESKIQLRQAQISDAAKILEIYRPYVENTAITFEYEVPGVEEFAGRIEKTLKKYPYLVAECDGEIVGYAYAGPFKTRAAYDWSVETSIYLKKDRMKQGIGKLLYAELERLLELQHITNVNACITSPIGNDPYADRNSIEFHAHLGYEMVGEFHLCGYKFGRWYNMVWMEKMLAVHPDLPQAVIPYPELVKE